MKYIYRILYLAVLVSVAYFVLGQLSEFKESILTLVQIRPESLLPAAVLSIVLIDSNIRIYQKSLRTIGVTLPYADAARTYLGAFFVNTVIPSGSFAGVGYMVLQGHRWGVNKANMILGALIQIFASYISFLIVFFIAAATQFIYTPNNPAVISATILLGVVTLLILALMLMLSSQFALFIKLVKFTRKTFGLKNGDSDSSHALYETLLNSHKSLLNFRKRAYLIVKPLLPALTAHIFGLGILLLAFWGLGFQISLSALLSGYVVGYLFTIVSVTPAGLGVVEIAIPLVLAGFGVPLPIGTAATLIYRIFTFWIILGLGGFSFRRNEALEAKSRSL